MGLLVEGTDYKVTNQPGAVFNEVLIETINTVDDGDTIALVLATYGIDAAGLLGVEAYEQTTDNSVVVSVIATTSVTTGTLTITIPGGNDNNPRVLIVKGKHDPGVGAAL